MSLIMIMEMKYNYLREEFLSVAQQQIDKNVLSTLKEYYAQCIDSNRKLSYTKDVRTLLRLLEKRDALNYKNIEPLLYISNNFLNDHYIHNKIKQYEIDLESQQYSSLCNMYKDISVSKESFTKHGNNSKIKSLNTAGNCTSQGSMCNRDPEHQSTSQRGVTNERTHFESEDTLKQMVLSQISERIGRSWRDTVRYLGIRESQIDMIQNKYPLDMKEQSYEALKLCIFQCSDNSWKLKLIHALEKARRKDLKELVEELILCTRFE